MFDFGSIFSGYQAIFDQIWGVFQQLFTSLFGGLSGFGL